MNFSFVKTSFCAALLLALGVFSGGQTAQADDEARVTLYEAQRFLEAFDGVVNTPAQQPLRSFLRDYVDERARFETRLVVTRVVQQNSYGAVYVAGQGHTVYHRFPFSYANAPTVQEVSYYTEDMQGLSVVLDNKRHSIAGYKQQSVLEGFSLSAGTHKAVADVSVQDLGARYSQLYQGLIEIVPYYSSRCQMDLEKKSGAVVLTGMRCQTLSAL